MKKNVTILFILFLFSTLLLQGCSNIWNKKNKKKKLHITRGTLVGDYASPGQNGLTPIKIEGFALAENLNGRGCVEPDTPMRKRLVEQFKKASIDKYQSRIDSSDTAIVYVHSYLRPGIQKGDPIDVHVQLPASSNAETLKNGVITIRSPLVQHFAGNDSFAYAYISGPILTDPLADLQTNPESEKSGFILGQATCLKPRLFTLIINEDDRSVLIAKEIQDKINARFKIPNESTGVATAKTDTRVELKLHPAYRDSVYRYLQVILSIACFENTEERKERMMELEEELLNPETAQYAALQYEAIGKAGVEYLRKGLASQNPDIRFYCAESLAFLGTPDAAVHLVEIVQTNPTHRLAALNALGTMQHDKSAETCLQELLLNEDPIIQYGAFRMLWHRNPYNPIIRGEQIGDELFTFSYHVLNIPTKPLIHVAKSKRSEIVLFSSDIHLQDSYILSAGLEIMIESKGPQQTVVTRLHPGRIPEQRTVNNSVDQVIRAITELGGTYPNVIEFLCEAKAKEKLSSDLKIDVFMSNDEDEDRQLLVGTASEDDQMGEVQPEKKSSLSKLNPVSWWKKEKPKPAILEEDDFDVTSFDD